jgi:hypothetical protein
VSVTQRAWGLGCSTLNPTRRPGHSQ